MLKNIKLFIECLIRLFIILIFNPVSSYIIQKFKNFCSFSYGYYIGREFKHIKSGYVFEYPFILKGGEYIKIGENFSTRARFRIEAWDHYHGINYNPTIQIGNNVIVNFDCHIGAINKIEIGDNVLIGSRVLITDHNHGNISKAELLIPPYLRPLYSKGPVIIEDNVWIGEGVAILPGIRIGKNSIIGANAVVNFDVPENCVVGGVPARVIKQF